MVDKHYSQKKSVSIIHPYIENRLCEIENETYPKNHLWGLDLFENDSFWQFNFLQTENTLCPKPIERIINKLFFKNSPGIKAEISAWKESLKTDLIYSVCGPLALSKFYRKTKIAAWVYQKPKNIKQNIIDPYSRRNLESHSALLCLTPKAQKHFSSFTKSKFIPWCIDLKMFDGKAPKTTCNKPFFLATGKTYRDYKTLVEGAKEVNAELRIIGPNQQKPESLPPNVKWLDTSSDPPDQTIDYPTLKEWYAQCIGVCIPLSGDADDTCGYTNMLEAMAMRKPVLATHSGCLHIKPETDGFGIQIKPRDSTGWTVAMNHLLKDHQKALVMGNHGRKIVERDFSIERFNQNVLRFIETIVKRVERR